MICPTAKAEYFSRGTGQISLIRQANFPSRRNGFAGRASGTSARSFLRRERFVRAFQGVDRHGWKRLEMLDAALTLADLAGLPSQRRAGSFVKRGRHRLPPHKCRRLVDGLLVIADATINIACPGYEAYLRHWLCVGTRPYKHVADLGDLTFRLLPRSQQLQAQLPC